MAKRSKYSNLMTIGMTALIIILLAAAFMYSQQANFIQNIQQGTSCGSVHAWASSVSSNTSTPIAVGRCFMSAYSSKSNATIKYAESGVDTYALYSMTTNAGRISVRETDRVNVMAPRNFTYQCGNASYYNSTGQAGTLMEINLTNCTGTYPSMFILLNYTPSR